MQISGIAFDNDGVLVDTEPIQWKGWVHVLKPFNVNFTKEDYIVYGLGHTTEHIANYLIQRFNLSIESHVLAEQKEKTVVEWFQTAPLNVMPFAIETLLAFREEKLPLALVSSAPMDEIMIKVKRGR